MNAKKTPAMCLKLTCCLAGLLLLMAPAAKAQKNSGIFYSTIFAKTGPYSRLDDFGKHADAFFLKDVNGDGKDDAIIAVPFGQFRVALSDGGRFTNPRAYLYYLRSSKAVQTLMGDTDGDGRADLAFFDPLTGSWEIALAADGKFLQPAQWASWSKGTAEKQLLADVNGDGKDDAIVFTREGGKGQWYAALSEGTEFGDFFLWIQGFGDDPGQLATGDVNGDGKADAIHYDKQVGSWKVTLSRGKKMIKGGSWRTGFGLNADTGFIYDVDRDGRDDIIAYHKAGWRVAYSTGKSFEGDHEWIAFHRPATMISRGNKPTPTVFLAGSISGKEAGACVISDGEWLYLENPDKNATVSALFTDNWTTWGNQYIPQVGGVSGTYDAGDTEVLDQQIKMIHDAGFTYIMLDITNGANAWVDDRAGRLIDRLRYWNEHLKPGEHPVYYCISMGGSRGMTGMKAAAACEAESKRTWTEFYERYPGGYYLQDGKPLLVHFVWDVDNSEEISSLAADMPYFSRFTIRWMYNNIANEPRYANAYGWPVLVKSGNPEGKEVMNVTPGFWNGSIGIARDRGEHYRSHWMRVLKFDPESVWLNSFNESWEHTSVEPAYLPAKAASAFPDLLETWTDYYGQRMDDFYWVMTKQYNRLFMYAQLFEHSYLQEPGQEEIYQVGANEIRPFGTSKPRMAPVLLVPEGFIRNFRGTVINEELDQVGSIQN